jgi:ribonuclease HII
MQQKLTKIVGVDEAGRGPLAGPVVAAAVLLPENHDITGLNDSKKLSAKKRAELEIAIRGQAIFGIGVVSVEDIDRINILQASLLAMHRAVKALNAPFDHILVDGNKLPQWEYAATAIVGGDALHPQISAASILAKELRDRMMCELALEHPHYAWDSNKGYGTAAHIKALKDHGPTDHHRRSFAPVAQMMLL